MGVQLDPTPERSYVLRKWLSGAHPGGHQERLVYGKPWPMEEIGSVCTFPSWAVALVFLGHHPEGSRSAHRVGTWSLNLAGLIDHIRGGVLVCWEVAFFADPFAGRRRGFCWGHRLVDPVVLQKSQDVSGRSFTHGLRTEGVLGRNRGLGDHEKTIQVLNLDGLVWWS
jgi:hypothetical protein